MIYSKTKYILLKVEDWLDRNLVSIISVSIILGIGLLGVLAHYKVEEKWYNEQITVYSDIEENQRWINKNY